MAFAIAGTALAFPTTARAQEPVKVTLEEALKRAVARNLTAITAQEEIRRAEALVVQARVASFPTLYGNAVYTRLDDDRSLNGRVIAGANSFNANLLLTVPIINPRAWGQWRHAKDNVEAVRASGEETKRQIAIGVGRAYLAIVAQKRVIESLERARDTAKAHFEFAQQRLAGGVGNRIDAVRAQQEVATDDSQVHTAYGGLVRAREALSVLVGSDSPLDAADEPALRSPELAAALDAAAQRSDVLAARSRVRAADRVVRDNWTDYSPYLTGTFTPFYQNPATLTQPLTGWQAQLILSVPLYDGGLRYGQAKEREALANEARETVFAALRQARSEVRSAFESMRRADDALKFAREAVSLARQSLELSELAYRAGATTNIEVIDAERRARDAETQAAVAEDGARQARLDLLVASGRFP